MSTMLGDYQQIAAGCNCPYPALKPKLTLVTLSKIFLQKLAYCILLLSISIGAGLLSGWSSTAMALPSEQILVPVWESLASADSTLFAQADTDPEANFVTVAVDKAESAVVQVNVSRALGGDVPDFLKPFLGGPQANPPGGQMLRGIGSGFVIDTAGRILTNAHVVDEADTVTVSSQDGRILEGKVLGKDPVTDVAVI